MGKSLVALDTDHIKGYVFSTQKLKEIRGASSLLDRLNRQVMEEQAQVLDKEHRIIYVNGGSGLFLINSEQADTFGQNVQRAYRAMTAGGASITYVVQDLPDGMPEEMEEILDFPLKETLTLMRYRLREAKECPPAFLTLPSHPLMHTCDACGIFYAEDKDRTGGIQDPDERDALYCRSCLRKRREDVEVKEYIDIVLGGSKTARQDDSGCTSASLDSKSPLWESIICLLRNRNYEFSDGIQRPRDFNAFREFRRSKEYMGLIYADANGMGKKLEELSTLRELHTFARTIDEAIYKVVADTIAQHLRIKQHLRQESTNDIKAAFFPFDILLLGGDDVVIVTPASVAVQVAQAIAKGFYQAAPTDGKVTDSGRSLSVGIVLAPVTYPFGLLLDLVEDALRFAKKDSAKAHTVERSAYGDTRINFLVVTGSTSKSFKSVYDALCKKDKKNIQPSFYATLRPYTVEDLDILLSALQKGNTLTLGRTKLHQLREAILQKNLTTSVIEGLAVLRNWKPNQRDFIVKQVYALGGRYPLHQWDDNPAALFPRVSFPWFATGKESGVDTYRTLLLDFVELYDFVALEEAEHSDEV